MNGPWFLYEGDVTYPEVSPTVEILDVSPAGVVAYRVAAGNENRGESGEVEVFPEFDHVGPIRSEAEEYAGENGPGVVIYILASASSISAFVSLLKLYLRRHADRVVKLAWKDGTPRLEVTGDLSVEDMERLLRAQLEPTADGKATELEEDKPDSAP